MKKYITLLLFTLIAAFSLKANTTPEVLYLQGFANNTGAFAQPVQYGWESFSRPEGTVTDVSTTGRIHYFNGGAAVESVNALTPHGDNITQGVYTAAVGVPQFSFTALSITPSHLTNISFELSNTAPAADSDWHVALRFGSDWYVSNTRFADATGYATQSLDITPESEWLALDFIPTGAAVDRRMDISEDPAVSFSTISGSITAVGFYGDIRASSTYRVDNFQVTGIPEPSTYAALAGAFGLGLVLLRRRARK